MMNGISSAGLLGMMRLDHGIDQLFLLFRRLVFLGKRLALQFVDDTVTTCALRADTTQLKVF